MTATVVLGLVLGAADPAWVDPAAAAVAAEVVRAADGEQADAVVPGDAVAPAGRAQEAEVRVAPVVLGAAR